MQLKNIWLVIASLIFFAWGGVSYTLILLGSIFLNYIFALLIERRLDKGAYWYLFAGVSCNILLLAIFKCADFATENISRLLQWLNLPPIHSRSI